MAHMERKEKSRQAAKFRRDEESKLITELSSCLPFQQNFTRTLHKSNILRLAMCYLQMKNVAQRPELSKGNQPKVAEGQLLLEALDGFLIFVSPKGQIIYVSSQVNSYLGLCQTDMIGWPLLNFVHPEDHKELLKQLMPCLRSPCDQRNNLKTYSDLFEVDDHWDFDDIDPRDMALNHDFYIRMKHKKKGSSLKWESYMLVHWTGVVSLRKVGASKKPQVKGIVGICRPSPIMPIVEIRLAGSAFISRHSMDLKYTFCDPRILTLIGYDPSEIVGHTAYEFHNPKDMLPCQKCHQILLDEGATTSHIYRFLGKTGCWVWLQTRATIVYSSKQEPQYIVCLNSLVSEAKGRKALEAMEKEETAETGDTGALAFTTLTVVPSQPAPLPAPVEQTPSAAQLPGGLTQPSSCALSLADLSQPRVLAPLLTTGLKPVSQAPTSLLELGDSQSPSPSLVKNSSDSVSLGLVQTVPPVFPLGAMGHLQSLAASSPISSCVMSPPHSSSEGLSHMLSPAPSSTLSVTGDQSTTLSPGSSPHMSSPLRSIPQCSDPASTGKSQLDDSPDNICCPDPGTSLGNGPHTGSDDDHLPIGLLDIPELGKDLIGKILKLSEQMNAGEFENALEGEDFAMLDTD